MNKTLTSAIFLLLVCGASSGQTAYRGLTPGVSTKADVERVLSRPAREIGEALAEYKSDQETEKIFVQYRGGDPIVERIEAVYPDALERANVIRSLRLPARPTASRVNTKGRLEEYFSAAYLVLTYAGAGAGGGVSRVGYYSRELFESASADLPPDGRDTGVAASPPRGSADPTEAPASATPSDPGGAHRSRARAGELSGEFTAADLRRFAGRYRFTSSTDNIFTEGSVGLAGGGELSLSIGSSTYILVARGKSKLTVGGGGVFDEFNFGVDGSPNAVVSFKVSGGVVKEMVFADERDGKFIFATAVPKP